MLSKCPVTLRKKLRLEVQAFVGMQMRTIVPPPSSDTRSAQTVPPCAPLPPPHDREPEPRAGPVPRRGQAVEAVEDVREVVQVDAGSAVADADLAVVDGDVDVSARRAPLRGVVERWTRRGAAARALRHDGRLQVLVERDLASGAAPGRPRRGRPRQAAPPPPRRAAARRRAPSRPRRRPAPSAPRSGHGRRPSRTSAPRPGASRARAARRSSAGSSAASAARARPRRRAAAARESSPPGAPSIVLKLVASRRSRRAAPPRPAC